MSSDRMNRSELRAASSLAGVFALRMLGLFLILPVFAVAAPKLRGGDNLTLVGIALGAYGLTQAMLQVPFGMASDRWGRKPVIYFGLAVFAVGSLLAASAGDIWTAIAGRALQGAGAISSVVVALAADLTREQHRTKAMAMIGGSIGLSFALSLVGAPALYRWIGMGGLFVLTAVLSVGAMAVLGTTVPDPGPLQAHVEAAEGSVGEALLSPELLRVNLGIFVLHASQMAMFVVLPPRLVASGLPLAAHWKVYLPVVLLSFVLMAPGIFYADRRNRPKPVLLGGIALLIAVEAGLASVGVTLYREIALLLGFFVAFNLLESMLPSLVSRLAPARLRGTAIGVYNTTQTLGLFCGGLLGGWVAKYYGAPTVFAVCGGLATLWLLAASGMRGMPAPVNGVSSLTLSIGSGVKLDGLRDALARVRGVHEAEVIAQERIARLKVVPGQWDESAARKLLTGEA